MDFARKQLEKYGWTDGKGLGKNENGMSQPLKPKLKRSMTGVGHNAASDFTEHWWSSLYDKAAKNIEVKERDGITKKIKTKDDTGFEITNSTWKLKRKKSKPKDVKPEEQYEDFFVRTAVLGSGGTRTERVRESESESEDDQVQKDVFKMTDEELFAACEGRTAHKGARHGLKALGKLARIEQQEKLLLQQSRFNGYSHASKSNKKKEYEEEVLEVASLNCEEVPVSKKRKKKKKHCLKQDNEDCQSEKSDEYCVKEISTKKEKKSPTNFDVSEYGTGNTELRKEKKRKLNTIDKDIDGGQSINTEELGLQMDVGSGSKKQKKRKHLKAFDDEIETNVNNIGKKNKKIVDTS